MPWEVRNGRRYYYQPARVNGKPRRIYYGTGVAGRLHELLAALERRMRTRRAAAARARTAVVAAQRVLVRAVLGWVARLVRAVRLVNGEHQHKGQWRRRTRPTIDTRTTPMTGTTGGGEEAVSLGERVERLNDRANGGDAAALAELDGLLTRHPEVWRACAEVAGDTASGWASLLGGGQALLEAGLRHEVAAWKARLGGPDPSPLVAAAVDASAVAWLAQRYAERELLRAPEPKRAAARKQLAAANRQLQDAIKLVITARDAADAAAARAATAENAGTASGPRLLSGTG